MSPDSQKGKTADVAIRVEFLFGDVVCRPSFEGMKLISGVGSTCFGSLEPVS